MGFFDNIVNSAYSRIVGSVDQESKIDNSDPLNKTRTITSQCKVVVYNWKSQRLRESGTLPNLLSQSDPIDISSRILNVSFTKSMSSPSGTFSISLANNPGVIKRNKKIEDWKDLIKPGTWCVIYMSQEGDLLLKSQVETPNKTESRRVRCIGYIERVSAKADVNEKGALEVTYEISGRDFGVIFEETTIWHNLFQYDKGILNALRGADLNVAGIKTLDQVLQTIHDLFYAPNKVKFTTMISDENSLTSIAKQWLLPTNMVKDLNMSYIGSSYYGNINNITDFQKTSATISVVQPLDYLTGNSWDQLKSLSIPEFHELFCETDEHGHMKLKFRLIPWAINKSTVAGVSVDLYKDLQPRVPIPAYDLISFDVGEDTHNRKNNFLTMIGTSLYGGTDNVSVLLGTKYPRQNRDSVQRHGFKPMHVTINSLAMNKSQNDGTGDLAKLLEYNDLLYDYWNPAVFFESGTLEKIGSNDVKIGKTLQFEDIVPYVGGKIFYIEEYTDTYIVEPTGAGLWTQSIKITRGAEEDDLKNNRGFASRNKKYVSAADYTEDNNNE